MKLSEEGKRLIYSFEGLHRKLPDGKYSAYLCPAGVPTIYSGLTEGVKIGMVVTAEEGEALFAKEIARFEDGVTQLVTEPLNQNEFDSCVSLAYNIGLAGFKRSSVLGFINQRKKERAAKAFDLWVRGGGRVLPGLVSRRKREAALFLKPVEAPQEPFMPQAVEASKEPMGAAKAAVSASAVVAPAAVMTTSAMVPPPPEAVTNAVSNAETWRTLGETVTGLGTLAASYPLAAAAIVAVCLGVIFGPQIKAYLPKLNWGEQS